MTRVKGEIVKRFCDGVEVRAGMIGNSNEAEIELPEVDVSKIGAGDELWVKMIVPAEHNYKHTFMTKHAGKFIYHIPQPEKEYCQCGRCVTPGWCIPVEEVNPPICSKCHKIIRLFKLVKEKKIEKITPWSERAWDQSESMILTETLLKLNEVIERVNCLTCGDKVTDCHCKE